MSEITRFYIGGDWVVPQSDEVAEILNPATGEVLTTAAVPSTKDAYAAIEAARKAFDEGPWPRLTPDDRAARVRHLGERLRARRDAIERMMILEVGATVPLSRSIQVPDALEAFDLCAEWSEDFEWEVALPPRTKPVIVNSLALREPAGVVAAITPFNYPFLTNCWKVAPAIAMGNTVVLKPSPWTPLDAFTIAEAAEEAEIPPGVINVIGGGGPEVGEELVTNAMVDMVSFTGGVATGRRVAAAAAATIKRVQLELGGKSAAIALDDADPADIAKRMMWTCMLHAGQGCGCTTRLLVPAAMHDEVVRALTDACARLRIGDPKDERTQLGPLIRAEHRERVERYVALGISEGATVVTGGKRPSLPAPLDGGFFYEPTVFTGVRNDMRIAQEEIFGPVLCVMPYADLEEAVRIANDSIFGLGGAVISPSNTRAMQVARRLRTGFVGINGGMANYFGSWGGYKQSGVGREWKLGLEEYTEIKHVTWVTP